jgi:hypothetical protein
MASKAVFEPSIGFSNSAQPNHMVVETKIELKPNFEHRSIQTQLSKLFAKVELEFELGKDTNPSFFFF